MNFPERHCKIVYSECRLRGYCNVNILCNLNSGPIAEYACPVFHNSLPKYLADELERLQKRALRIIFSYQLSFGEALAASNLSSLYDRRVRLKKELFQISRPTVITSYTAYYLIRTRNINLRNKRNFNVPKCSTNRLKTVLYIIIVSKEKIRTFYHFYY